MNKELAIKEAETQLKNICNDISVDNIYREDDDFYFVFAYPISYVKIKKHIPSLLDCANVSFCKENTFCSVTRKFCNCVIIVCKIRKISKPQDETSKDKVIGRIEKLLAVAQGTANENESIMASVKAQKLMAEYHMELSDTHKAGEDIVMLSYEVPSGYRWKFKLINVVGRNYCCECLTNQNATRFTFCGYERDCVIARRMFDFLFKQAISCGNKYVREQKNAYGYNQPNALSAYCYGFVEGVGQELDKQCYALKLMVSDEVVAFTEEKEKPEKFKDKTRKRSIEIDAYTYEKGIVDGKNCVRGTSLDTNADKLDTNNN